MILLHSSCTLVAMCYYIWWSGHGLAVRTELACIDWPFVANAAFSPVQ